MATFIEKTTPPDDGEGSDSLLFVIAPSDLVFLFEECPRCFWLKVVRNVRRPSTPMAAVFRVLDRVQKECHNGARASKLHATLADGIVDCGEIGVRSRPIPIPGTRSSLIFAGSMDGLVRFTRGGICVFDFKTTEPGDWHVALYPRQLHAYAWACEKPAHGWQMHAPVLRLGLSCFEPTAMTYNGSDVVWHVTKTWIDVPRDDAAFTAFLVEVCGVLKSATPPDPDPRCRFCAWRQPRAEEAGAALGPGERQSDFIAGDYPLEAADELFPEPLLGTDIFPDDFADA